MNVLIMFLNKKTNLDWCVLVYVGYLNLDITILLLNHTNIILLKCQVMSRLFNKHD